MPGLTVMVPTQGRDTLERLLASIVDAGLGASPHDETLIMVDTLDMAPGEFDAIVTRVAPFGSVFRVVDAGVDHHCYGHCALNQAMAIARPGNYITGNDDDDVYTPAAFGAMRKAIEDDIAEGRPRLHIFPFISYWRQRLPEGHILRKGRCGGHNICVPNVAGKVGRFTCDYDGDWSWVSSTAELWDDDIVFEDTVVAICRPG